jgi:hypothetical protein
MIGLTELQLVRRFPCGWEGRLICWLVRGYERAVAVELLMNCILST